MDFSVQDINSLKIRGKHASVYINPHDKTATYNMAILLGKPTPDNLSIREEIVVINGPGEYEAGGIKVSGIQADTETVYSLNIDNTDVILGSREALEKVHQKLKEHHVAVIYAQNSGNTAFATTLGMNAILFFGEQAKEAIDTLAKNEKKETTKYTISGDKLPSETETVLLIGS